MNKILTWTVLLTCSSYQSSVFAAELSLSLDEGIENKQEEPILKVVFEELALPQIQAIQVPEVETLPVNASITLLHCAEEVAETKLKEEASLACDDLESEQEMFQVSAIFTFSIPEESEMSSFFSVEGNASIPKGMAESFPIQLSQVSLPNPEAPSVLENQEEKLVAELDSDDICFSFEQLAPEEAQIVEEAFEQELSSIEIQEKNVELASSDTQEEAFEQELSSVEVQEKDVELVSSDTQEEAFEQELSSIEIQEKDVELVSSDTQEEAFEQELSSVEVQEKDVELASSNIQEETPLLALSSIEAQVIEVELTSASIQGEIAAAEMHEDVISMPVEESPDVLVFSVPKDAFIADSQEGADRDLYGSSVNKKKEKKPRTNLIANIAIGVVSAVVVVVSAILGSS